MVVSLTGRANLWFHGNFAETMPGPIPVLCLDAVRRCLPYFGLPNFAKDLVKEMKSEPIEFLAGRVCWNISFLMGAGLINRNAIRIMKFIDARMVTASMGLVEQPQRNRVKSDFVTLYSHCDRLLYEAKRAGRNRTMSEKMQSFASRPKSKPAAA